MPLQLLAVDVNVVLFSLAVLLLATIAFVLFLQSLPRQPQHNQSVALRYFTGFFVTGFVAFTLYCLRYSGWYVGSVISGNTMYLASLYLFYYGIRARFNLAGSGKLLCFVLLHVLSLTLLMWLFTTVFDVLHIRLPIFLLSMCLPLLLSFRTIRTEGRRDNLGDRIMQLSVLLAMLTLPTLYPLFSVLMLPDHHNQIMVTTLVTLTLETLCIGGIAISYIYDLIDKLRLDAYTDKLTSCKNRRYFFRFAPALLQQAASLQQHCALVMVDLDHFKQINDHFGHQVGDQVLQHFAAQVRAVLPANAMLVRYGGEEFVLFIPDFSKQQAVALVENVQEKLVQPLVIDGQNIGLSASFGLTVLTPATELEQAIRTADAALYRAKHAGRNRLELG